MEKKTRLVRSCSSRWELINVPRFAGEGRRAIQYFDVRNDEVDKEASRMQDELRERVEARLQKQRANYTLYNCSKFREYNILAM